MAQTVDMGTISARGQVAIPAEIRAKMRLREGRKVLFLLEGDTLLMKPVEDLSWEEITRPLRAAKKRIRRQDVPAVVEKVRKR